MTALSMTLRSSRMLPGHGYLLKESMTAGEKPLIFLPSLLEKKIRQFAAISTRSLGLALRPGIVTATTFNR